MNAREKLLRFIQYVVYGTIIALNTVGDLVLRFFAFLGQKIKRLIQSIVSAVHSIGSRVHLRIPTIRPRSPIRLLLSSLRHFKLPTQSKKRSKKKKVATTLPAKIPLRIKVRYFLRGFVFACLFVFLPLLFLVFLQELPDPRELAVRQVPQTTKIYDRHGTLLYQIYASENRTLVPLTDIPNTMQQATIAIEDKNFYTHPGFDISAILRAFRSDTGGGNFQGGSTITQQLIKSSMLTPEPSLVRKIKEVILAFWAERIYTKKQILAMYFNQVPYGGTSWGIEAASEVYFDKHVKDIDLAESAFLAGLTSAPTAYSPYGENPNLWKKRQAEVLSRMVSLHFITQAQATAAKQEELHFKTQQTPILAPHFVNYIRDLLIQKYGLPTVEKGGLQVKTTLDLTLQNQVQAIVADEVNKASYLNLTNGAVLVTDPKTGEILAMIGSKDYDDPDFGKVNVTTSLRQPGSSIKVVTYAAALSHGFTPATILDDSPITYTSPDGGPSYSPVNYDGRFHGRVPLRLALANSLNIPAVKTLNQVGVPTMITLGKQMGITTWDNAKDYGLSITLGGADVTMLDMAQVYGTLANNGTHVSLTPILSITDYKGSVIEAPKPQSHQVLDPGVTYLLSDILADNTARSMEFGPNSPLHIPDHTVSVKTGTTDNKRDNWTIGYTPDVVVTTWVGNNDNSPMSQDLASGITGAAPIWNRVMTVMLGRKSESKRDMPGDVVVKPCLGRMEYFLKGTENSVSCGNFPLTTTPQPTH